MFSRLTAFAIAFAAIAAAAIAITAQAHAPVTKTIRVVELPRVVVVAHRLDRPAH